MAKCLEPHHDFTTYDCMTCRLEGHAPTLPRFLDLQVVTFQIASREVVMSRSRGVVMWSQALCRINGE